MRALAAEELLEVWERGLAQTPAQRALGLLATACADMPREELAQLSAGQRDTRLLELRERTFGPSLTSMATCPECEGRIEFTLGVADLRLPSPKSLETLVVTEAGCEVTFRLPTGRDLANLDPAADNETNRQQLLQQCVIAAQRAGEEITAAELPANVVAALTQRMAEADPSADLQIALKCPECSHAWQAPLDIVSYFWSEIHAWASRALHEVHLLASAYGWSEADVLALSPWRRQAYLEMIQL